MKSRNMLVFTLALLVAIVLAASYSASQTLLQGDIFGTVTDPTGAVVPGATVTAKNNDTGSSQTTTTNRTGTYRFSLLQPGSYVLTFSAPNYQSISRTVGVTVGQVATVNSQLAVAASQQTVTVTAEAGVVQTESPNLATTMSQEQVELVPNGAGDLSYIAQTAPGSFMNTQSGYGNFSSYGAPAISNNFTFNSMPVNDPFLNLNNSGATNVLLGQNDVREATIVTNGYSGQYSMTGANVNYVSKSGSNAYHGNAIWYWNGRYVNANNYFNKQTVPEAPRGFVNSNQWGASFGGPIKKDKTFFFANTEGLYVLVPVTRQINVPSPGFESAVLANIAGTSPAQLPFYQNMFALWRNAPGANRAANVLDDGGCADLAGGGTFGVGNPCALRFNSTVGASTHEWIITGRADHTFGPNDKAFVHVRTNQGEQATYTDPLNPIFNVTSKQPQWEGQLQESHTFSPRTVNSFILNASYYRAVFAHPDQAATLAAQPVGVNFAGNTLRSLGANYAIFPQGRNVTQYGFVDDVSHSRGSHEFKLGINFARYDITTYGPGIGTLPVVNSESLGDFFSGVGTNFTQSFPDRSTQPVNMYRLGFYGSDEWRVKRNLKLTLTLRADRNSNPSCTTDCFNRLVGPFQSIPHGLDVPYNQTILAGQNKALGDYGPWEVQPRFGFTYSPFGGNSDLVISGGFGIFADVLPIGFVDDLINNLPGAPAFIVSGQPFAPNVAGNAQSSAAAAASALKTGFAQGATYADLNAAVNALTGSNFAVPNFFNVGNGIHLPRAQKWNLQVQKGIGDKMALSLQYVGNHAIHQQVVNGGLNAYCGPTVASTSSGQACLDNPLTGEPGALGGVSSFAGLPALPADPRFLQISEVSTPYRSNYNGLTVSFLRRMSAFQFQLNYTYSHAFDYLSNNGQYAEPYNDTDNTTSIAFPQNPFNIFQNMYGNSDYDIRHYFSMNYVWNTPKNIMHGFLGGVLAGWTVSGTLFWHTGTPFTAVDSGTGGVLNAYGYGGATNPNASAGILGTFAQQTGGTGVCNGVFARLDTGPCPALANNFTPDATGFGNQRRNQLYGPKFFNTDLSVMKLFKIPGREGMNVGIGANFYNLFNHPNFQQPVADIANPNFGKILGTVNPPTSIYGAFLGADSSPRVIQAKIKFEF